MDNAQPQGSDTSKSLQELLTSCVHCGLCLEVCPTYQLTGDENNSPRGRLRLWREEADGRLPADPWTARYTAECVGCLACESACPANVPYGRILEQVRHAHVATDRTRMPWRMRAIAALVQRLPWMQRAAIPLRALRALGIAPHPWLFPGKPSVLQSTAQYARQLVARRRPTGPRVALLTGCLMEAVFREINFATVRVLVANNCQVSVPAGQSCCGAVLEHLGVDGAHALQQQNLAVFAHGDYDVALCNSSGCGLALQHALAGRMPVRDVLEFLGQMDVTPVSRKRSSARVYVDLPCHLVHGQKVAGIPASVLDATGLPWELAPYARDCCGSGGVYNVQQPDNARAILARKAEFLNTAAGDPVILATANHVCMMQWHSAQRSGFVQRPFQVRHVIQLLDPSTTAF